MAGGCPTSPQPPQRAKWRQAATGAVAGRGCRQPGGGSPIPAGEATGCRAGPSAPGPAACSSAERLPQPGRPPEPASLLTAPSGSICQPPPPQLRHVPGTRRVLGPADELRGEAKRGQGWGCRAGTRQPFLTPAPRAPPPSFLVLPFESPAAPSSLPARWRRHSPPAPQGPAGPQAKSGRSCPLLSRPLLSRAPRLFSGPNGTKNPPPSPKRSCSLRVALRAVSKGGRNIVQAFYSSDFITGEAEVLSTTLRLLLLPEGSGACCPDHCATQGQG